MATKLHVPTLRRGLVARPRLLESVRRGADSRLTLVSAPVGFGKTTLLADWLHEDPGTDHHVAWLSLDASDNDPAAFWTYVVTALQGAVPGVGTGALDLIGLAPFPTELVLTTVINDLTAVSNDLWLVLDDFHLVDDPDIGRGMTFFIQHIPAHVHVLISTRADPDLPLARWRARGELVEIRAADLRFTPAETTDYLTATTGLRLSAGDVATLGERTEGWIAALQLAALSLHGHDDAGGFIGRFAGTDRYVVDYLVEEVLAHQSDAVRVFLLHSAILDRLTGPLCDAVVGHGGGSGSGSGSEMLRALERANLFLIALDDQRTWFRYHHLFADLLRARLLAEQPDLVPLLHQRASRWYEAHDLIEEAVRHALAAREVDRAVYLIELAVPALRRHRQEAMLLGWLGELPDDAIGRSPVLSAFHGYMLMTAGDLAGFEARLDDADRALATASAGSARPWADTDELRTLPATIAVYRASLAQARGDVTSTAAHAHRALELAGPDDHLARGSAAGFLALVAWARGDVTSALATFTQAISSLHAAENLVDELSSTVVLADLWLAAGRPATARRVLERALQTAAEHGDAVMRATPDLHVGLGELDYERGDLDGAARHLASAAALGASATMTENRYRSFVLLARIASADGRADDAIAHLDQAEGAYRPGFFPDVRPVAAIRARVRIAHGRLADAADWARERGADAVADTGYLSEYDRLTMVRLWVGQYRAAQDPDALALALRALTASRTAAAAAARCGSLIEIQMLTALAHDARGSRAQALECLDDACSLVPEPDAYARLFLDEGAPMTELLRATDLPEHVRDHAHRLLGLGAASASSATDAGRTSPSPTEQLSERELQVLRMLASELTGPQIARELFVTINTLRSHTKRIFTKLGVTTRWAAVRRARDAGLL